MPFSSKDSCALSGLGLVNETIVITVMAAFAYELPSLRSGLQLNSAGGVVFPFRTWNLYRVGLQRLRTGYRGKQRETEKDPFISPPKYI